MTLDKMNQDLQKVKEISSVSKLKRMLHHPLKYIYAIVYRQLIYRVYKKEIVVNTRLFYGKKMKIALPASTDIFLTGGKSHASEIRLAKFLITNLKAGHHFLDVGAHYGYFTLIASEIVGDSGKICAFEPSRKSFNILSQNAGELKNTQVSNKAVANSCGNICFYEFSNLQSEYNSLNIAQFEKEAWFKHAPPSKIEVRATTIDTITQKSSQFVPDIIKIDVEGSEFDVIQGGLHFFNSNTPTVIMEYVEPERMNDAHRKAIDLFRKMGYISHIIEENGSLTELYEIDGYLKTQKLESDNIVLKRTFRK